MSDPGLGNYDAATDDSALDYGDEAVASGRAAVRVAEVEPKPRKRAVRPARKRDARWKSIADGPHQPAAAIYILYYLGSSRVLSEFEQKLHGTSDPNRYFETSAFIQAGISVTIKQDSSTVWADLGNALHEPGAIVVHMSHSFRLENNAAASAIRPRTDSDDASADISVAQLASLVKTMNAKAFILASCATDGCLARVKRDTALVVTDSGLNKVTIEDDWFRSLLELLRKLVAGGTIQSAIDAANVALPSQANPDDRFVVVSGKTDMTLTS